MDLNPKLRITSAAQANKEADKLKSVISGDSYLMLRVMIYHADLLEQILNHPARGAAPPAEKCRYVAPTDPEPTMVAFAAAATRAIDEVVPK